jgi:hypothetical protein
LRFSIRSSDSTVVDVSRYAACQNSWPAVAGFRPPSAPDVLTMLRRPLSSGFAAVAEFGFAMYTKCVPAVVLIDEPIVIVGADADSARRDRGAGERARRCPRWCRCRRPRPGRSQLRTIASYPYAVPDGDATEGPSWTRRRSPHAATMPSPFVTSCRVAWLRSDAIAP